MRILNVTETYAPFLEFGGPPVKVRALAEGLAKKGHQVTVLTADWGLEKRAEERKEKITGERSPFGWRLREGGVEAIYLPTWLHYRRVSWNPAVKRYCRVWLEKFDVVHIFGLYDLLGPGVAGACRKRGVPYVVEPIGMFVPIVRNLWLKRVYHRALGRRLLAGACRLVATSEQEIEELVAGGIDRSKVVMRRNGVERPESWQEPGTFRKKMGIPEESKLVLYLGRLNEKKSPDLLLEAFAETQKRVPAEMTLVFAGPDEGGMQTKLERLAIQTGITTSVRFAGPIFDQDKWAAYRDASVFVLPSQNENFGNTAAEAVAAGTPVIVTEGCGIAPLLDEAGLVVRHEASALTEALESILADSELRGHLKAGCVKVAKSLGWETPIQEMEQLYARCVSQAQSGNAERV